MTTHRPFWEIQYNLKFSDECFMSSFVIATYVVLVRYVDVKWRVRARTRQYFWDKFIGQTSL